MPRLGFRGSRAEEESDKEDKLAVARRRKRYEREFGTRFRRDGNDDEDEDYEEKDMEEEIDNNNSNGGRDNDDSEDEEDMRAISITKRKANSALNLRPGSSLAAKDLRYSTKPLDSLSDREMASWTDSNHRNILQVCIAADNVEAVRIVLRRLIQQKVERCRREDERQLRAARRELAQMQLGSMPSALSSCEGRVKARKHQVESLAQIAENFFKEIACQPDKNGWTSFHYAAQSRSSCISELLEGPHLARLSALSNPKTQDQMYTERSLMVSVRDSTGCTPLHIAAANGNASAIRALLRWNADFSIKNLDNDLPIDVAIDRVTRRALQAGLRAPTTMSSTDRIARSQKLSEGTKISLQTLCECGENVNERFGLSLQASLHEAARAGDLQVVKFLVEESKEADVNIVDANGRTPLHMAAQESSAVHRTIADILLRNGAKVNHASHAGYTPLHAVAASSCSSSKNKQLMVALLIRAGARLEAKTEKGLSPLLLASKHGHVGVVYELILSGCKLNSLDDKLWNALHFATFYKHFELVHLLAYADAEVQVLQHNRNSHGKLPSDLCRDSRFRDALKSTWEYASEGCIDKLRSALRDENGQASWILQEDLWKSITKNINQQTLRHKYTILHTAILGDQFSHRHISHSRDGKSTKSVEQTVRYILGLKGISVNASDVQGRTPLMLAVMLGRREIAEELVKRGASLSHLDRAGNNVLHYANAYLQTGFIGRLISASEMEEDESALDIENHHGQRPFDVAGLKKHMIVPGVQSLCKNRTPKHGQRSSRLATHADDGSKFPKTEGHGAEQDEAEESKDEEAERSSESIAERTQRTLKEVAREIQE